MKKLDKNTLIAAALTGLSLSPNTFGSGGSSQSTSARGLQLNPNSQILNRIFSRDQQENSDLMEDEVQNLIDDVKQDLMHDEKQEDEERSSILNLPPDAIRQVSGFLRYKDIWNMLISHSELLIYNAAIWDEIAPNFQLLEELSSTNQIQAKAAADLLLKILPTDPEFLKKLDRKITHHQQELAFEFNQDFYPWNISDWDSPKMDILLQAIKKVIKQEPRSLPEIIPVLSVYSQVKLAQYFFQNAEFGHLIALMKAGSEPDLHGATIPTHFANWAVEFDRLDLLAAVIQGGLRKDVNGKYHLKRLKENLFNLDPLMAAVQFDKLPAMEILFEVLPDEILIEWASKEEKTYFILEYAREQGNQAMIDFLTSPTAKARFTAAVRRLKGQTKAEEVAQSDASPTINAAHRLTALTQTGEAILRKIQKSEN